MRFDPAAHSLILVSPSKNLNNHDNLYGLEGEHMADDDTTTKNPVTTKIVNSAPPVRCATVPTSPGDIDDLLDELNPLDRGDAETRLMLGLMTDMLAEMRALREAVDSLGSVKW